MPVGMFIAGILLNATDAAARRADRVLTTSNRNVAAAQHQDHHQGDRSRLL
jgi:hypothetical protein